MLIVAYDTVEVSGLHVHATLSDNSTLTIALLISEPSTHPSHIEYWNIASYHDRWTPNHKSRTPSENFRAPSRTSHNNSNVQTHSKSHSFQLPVGRFTKTVVVHAREIALLLHRDARLRRHACGDRSVRVWGEELGAGFVEDTRGETRWVELSHLSLCEWKVWLRLLRWIRDAETCSVI